jgi:Ca-activated chloride channel family protein
MSFAKINFLYVIWVIPILLGLFIYGSRRRQHILNDFSAPRGLLALVPQKSAYRRWIKAVFILTAILLIAVSLAGPQYGYSWEKVEQKGVDLVIALDCSRSMLADDIKPNRLKRAKQEIYDLLALVKGDRVGLVAFAGTAFLQCPLTLDTNGFYLFLNVLSPDYLPVGGTDLEAAVTTAIAAFDPKSYAEKAVILITDGEHTGRGDPIAAAKKAADAGIKLFCIGVGGAEGVPLKEKAGGFTKDSSGRIVLSRLDEATLKEMAAEGKGIYVPSVAGDMDLDRIYTQEIRGKMNAATLSGGHRHVHQNRYQWPLLIAVILLLLERCIPVVRLRPPILALLLTLTPVLLPAHVQANEIDKGVSAYKNGDYSKAIDHFSAAQLDDPDRPELLYDLGSAFYKNKDYDAAETHLRQALLKADPTLKAKIHYDLGNIDFRKGRLKEAVKNYQEALKFAPNDNQTKENIEFVKKAMQQKPPPSKQKGDQKGKKDSSQKKKQGQNRTNQQEQAANNSKAKPSSKPSQGTDKPSKKKKTPTPSSGKMDADKKMPSPKASQKQSASQNTHDESSQRMSKASDDQNRQQAERLLNRLKDQPGRATMPAYGETPVEKNW